MKKWYDIKAKGNNKAEIYIYEQIGEDYWTGEGVSSKKFVSELKALGDITQIDLHINSPGGSVFEATPIYNELKRHKANVTSIIDGLAASAASVIAMAGNQIVMPANAMMMIHEPWTLAMGNSNDLKKSADLLEKISDSLITIYQEKTGLEADEIRQMMLDETWFTAAEAKEKGFADAIEAANNVSASFDLSKFKNVPKQFLNVLNEVPIKPENKGEPLKMEITLDKIKNDYPEIAKALQSQGYDDGFKAGKEEGIKAETQRIKDVEEQLIQGCEDIINTLKFDGKTTGPEAAVKVLQTQKSKLAAVKNNLKADAPEPLPVVKEQENVSDFSHLSIEDRCKAQWEKGADIRNEFNTFEAFLAFTKAEENGQIKILNK